LPDVWYSIINIGQTNFRKLEVDLTSDVYQYTHYACLKEITVIDLLNEKIVFE
jgi:hypothetical protein